MGREEKVCIPHSEIIFTLRHLVDTDYSHE